MDDDDDAFWNNVSFEEVDRAISAATAGSRVASLSQPSFEFSMACAGRQPSAPAVSGAIAGVNGRSGVQKPQHTANPNSSLQGAEALNEEQRSVVESPLDVPLIVIARFLDCALFASPRARSAGSGKTSTIIKRIQRICQETPPPKSLLCISFSKAAADELKKRLGKLLGSRVASEVHASTFHSFGLSICREYAERIGDGGFTREFSCVSRFTQRELAKEARRLFDQQRQDAAAGPAAAHPEGAAEAEARARREGEEAKRLASAVQRLKNGGLLGASDLVKFALEHYNRRLREMNAMDFTDMIKHAHALLLAHEDVRAAVCARYCHVVVDEVQDTSRAQLGLLLRVAAHGRLTLVGDDDQTIYRFTGACEDNFARLRAAFPAARTLHLSTNYRSTGRIVSAAMALIERNERREAKRVRVPDARAGGDPPLLVEARTVECELSFLVRTIEELRRDGRPLADVAVLCRTQRVCAEAVEALQTAGIPVTRRGCSRKALLDVASLLYLATNGRDDAAFASLALVAGLVHEKSARDAVARRAAERGVPMLEAAAQLLELHPPPPKARGRSKGAKAPDREGDPEALSAAARKGLQHLVEAVRSLRFNMGKLKLAELAGRKAVEALCRLSQGKAAALRGGGPGGEEEPLQAELCALAEEFEREYDGLRDPEAVVRALADRLTQAEEERERARKKAAGDAVVVSTVHGAKGLEWGAVFVLRMNEGEFPQRSRGGRGEDGTDDGHLEDERRLAFVAMSRARERLYLSHAMSCPEHGVLQPSTFVRELQAHPGLVRRGEATELHPALAARRRPPVGPVESRPPAPAAAAACSGGPAPSFRSAAGRPMQAGSPSASGKRPRG